MALTDYQMEQLFKQSLAEELAGLDYTNCKLVEITTLEQAKDEADEMQHELHYMWKHKHLASRTRIFSVRDTNDKRVLTLSFPDNGICTHVVGRRNRRPTEQELKLLVPLLSNLGVVLDYSHESIDF